MERTHIALVLLTLAFTSGEALKCYQCTSSNPKCNDPLDKTAIQPTECSTQSVDSVLQFASGVADAIGNTFNTGSGSTPDLTWTCIKAEYKMASGDLLVRTCNIPKSVGFDPCMLKGKDDKPTFCGVCEGDGCNSAVRLGGISALFYLFVPCLVALKAVAA